MFRRFSKYAIPVAIALLAGCGLHAQSSTDSAPAFGTPASSPNMPVGTVAGTPSSESGSDADPTGGNASGVIPTRPDTRIAPQVGTDYKIGADDVLTINVWHEPEVSRNVPVRPDGMISLPLVGDVQAAGLTPTQLQKVLERRFIKFLSNPAVSVIVASIRSQRVNVLGQVSRPGTYPLIPPMTVIDAIATAGGLREFAKPNKIYVLRTLSNGQRVRLKFQYNNVLKGKPGSSDLALQTRDTVVVP